MGLKHCVKLFVSKLIPMSMKPAPSQSAPPPMGAMHSEPTPPFQKPSGAGRPKAMTDIDIGKMLVWKSDKIKNVEIARRLGVAESTVRKYLKEYQLNDTKL